MSTPTPGPWRFIPALPRSVYAGTDADPICIGRTDLPGLPLAESASNAQMFAASKDMLAALRWAVGMAEEAILVREGGDDPEDTLEIIAMHREQLDAARAAIARAEGDDA